jgi:hypothetical protein
MWILTNDNTGAIIIGPVEEAPQVGEGQTLREVPLNTKWDPYRRAFGDDTRIISKFDFVLLWPVEATLAIHTSTDAAMARAWALLLGWEGSINLEDPLVLTGILRAEQLEIITSEQAQRIREGLPPL